MTIENIGSLSSWHRAGWVMVLLFFLPLGCAAAKPKTDVTGHNAKQSTKTGEDEFSTGTKKKTAQSNSHAAKSSDSGAAHEPNEGNSSKTVYFEWCPKPKFKESYEMSDQADQHRIVLPKGWEKGKSYPVVVAFHGQPKRGKNPRDYMFMAPVEQKVMEMVDDKEIEPVILVMPVFRFYGTNWPMFHPKRFLQKIEEILSEDEITPTDWYAFGHSGAAGCGGAGLNQIHLIDPKGVGFFDTCLGDGWKNEIAALQRAKIKTFNIHSVETAGFKPKQRPEYQADFDFGRAYSPLGIDAISCPEKQPGPNLRTLDHRCSATSDGVINAFVIDTGEGKQAHKDILDPAIDFFLKYFLAMP